jgi:Thioredoxin-like domain
MGAVTYSNKKVIRYVSGNYVPWKVDYDRESRLLRRYNVVWTPVVVLADERGEERDRLTGYLPPEPFLAHLAMGRSRIALAAHDYPEAAELFDTVARDFPGSGLAPEAVYFRAIARRKATGDDAHLDHAVAELEREYPDSEWLLRARPWMGED